MKQALKWWISITDQLASEMGVAQNSGTAIKPKSKKSYSCCKAINVEVSVWINISLNCFSLQICLLRTGDIPLSISGMSHAYCSLIPNSILFIPNYIPLLNIQLYPLFACAIQVYSIDIPVFVPMSNFTQHCHGRFGHLLDVSDGLAKPISHPQPRRTAVV